MTEIIQIKMFNTKNKHNLRYKQISVLNLHKNKTGSKYLSNKFLDFKNTITNMQERF